MRPHLSRTARTVLAAAGLVTALGGCYLPSGGGAPVAVYCGGDAPGGLRDAPPLQLGQQASCNDSLTGLTDDDAYFIFERTVPVAGGAVIEVTCGQELGTGGTWEVLDVESGGQQTVHGSGTCDDDPTLVAIPGSGVVGAHIVLVVHHPRTSGEVLIQAMGQG